MPNHDSIILPKRTPKEEYSKKIGRDRANYRSTFPPEQRIMRSGREVEGFASLAGRKGRGAA